MKTKTVLLWVAVCAFIWVITSCGKDGVVEELPVPEPEEQDTVYYVIDTTKKITINEIKFLEDYNMAAVSGNWYGVAAKTN
jgi:hypothetical protein